MVPMMAPTATATLVAFHVDGYSARLPAYTADGAPAAPAGSRADRRQ